MNKLYSLTLAACALVNLCSAAVDTDKLEEAIEQSELSRVKNIFKKVEREEMAPSARKKLLSDLYDTAAEVTERRTSGMSLFGNWRDALKTGLGCASGILSGLAIYMSFNYNQRDRIWYCASKSIAGAGVAGLFGSGYLLYKGITCSTQKGGVAQAKSVEKFLKGKLNNDGDVEPAK